MLRKVTFTISRIVEVDDPKSDEDYIDQAWFEVYDSGDASNVPGRSKVTVEEVNLTDEEWEKYCNGEEMKGCPSLDTCR